MVTKMGSPSTFGKIGASKSSELDLTAAIEEVRAHREAVLRLHGKMEDELERLEMAVEAELRLRNKKIELRDVVCALGIAMVGTGVAIATHWSYALITVGVVFVALPVLPLLRSSGKG